MGQENMDHGSTERQKQSVLVVDDESGYRDMLQWSLKKYAVHVDVAKDGAEALHLIANSHYSVIITDITMPRLDGLKLLDEVKKSNPQAFVIIVTGFGTVESAVYAMKKGAFDFILKPFDLEVLLNRVKQALSLD